VNLNHVEWPFFDAKHRVLASAFAEWATTHLGGFEGDEGNDGIAAREIFKELGRNGGSTTRLPAKVDESPPLLICAVHVSCESVALTLLESWM